MGIGFTYPSELFDRFKDIHNKDTYALIRLFERNEESLRYLHPEEQVIVLCYYCNALFAAEDYSKHLRYARLLLERSIIENVQYVDGYDIYLHTLQQLVLSNIMCGQPEEAIKIAQQLLRLAPKNKKYRQLLRQAFLKQRPEWVLKVLAVAIIAIGLWVGIEIVQLVIYEPLSPTVAYMLGSLQYTAVSLGAITLLSGWIAHYFYVGRFINAALRK